MHHTTAWNIHLVQRTFVSGVVAWKAIRVILAGTATFRMTQMIQQFALFATLLLMPLHGLILEALVMMETKTHALTLALGWETVSGRQHVLTLGSAQVSILRYTPLNF